MYLISYTISKPEIQEAVVNEISGIGESVVLFPNTRVLDSQLGCEDIFTRLCELIETADQILIVPFELSKIQGYINNNVVNWLISRS